MGKIVSLALLFYSCNFIGDKEYFNTLQRIEKEYHSDWEKFKIFDAISEVVEAKTPVPSMLTLCSPL